jgi:hypothetical protein
MTTCWVRSWSWLRMGTEGGEKSEMSEVEQMAKLR